MTACEGGACWGGGGLGGAGGSDMSWLACLFRLAFFQNLSLLPEGLLSSLGMASVLLLGSCALIMFGPASVNGPLARCCVPMRALLALGGSALSACDLRRGPYLGVSGR